MTKSRSGAMNARLLSGTMIATALLVGLPQQASAEDASHGMSSDDEAIVVTAQRREQSTYEVGINVTQFSVEELQTQKVSKISDLTQLVSNVEVRELRPGGGLPSITIRGVGMNDYTVASNPSVAVYYDGVYSPNVGTIGQQFFDLESVEILKGPQSSLYGRNATAGVTNVTSAAPTEILSGYVSAGIGNFDSYEAEGAISGPLAQGLTTRISLRTKQSYDGWMTNLYPGGSDIGEIHQFAGRAQLKWDASDRMSFHLTAGYQREDDEPGAFSSFGRRVPGGTLSTPASSFCAVALAGQIDFGNSCASMFGAQRTDTDVLTISENDSWKVEGESYTGTFKAVYHADGFDISSLTGYLHWKERYNKADGLPITESRAVLDQRTWQISQDLQIASTGKRDLDWMVGIYLSSGNTDNPSTSYSRPSGGTFFSTNDADVRTAQAYAQLDYNLTPKLQLTAGARFIYEYDSKIGGNWFDLNVNGVLDSGDRQNAAIDDSFDQNSLTWKVGLNFKPDPATLLYGSITHGYKSGGYIGPQFASSDAQLLPYKGEDIYAFEIGAKKSLFDRLIDLSASLFYYDYQDLQTNTQTLVGGLLLDRFANIEKAHVKGFDFEARIRPVEGLELGVDMGLIDTWVGSFTSFGKTYAPGNRFANAPEFSGSASARYEFALTDKVDLAVGGNVFRQGKVFSDTENTALYAIESDATLVNAQLQLAIPSSGWTAMIWGKNLTNETYSVSTFQNASVVFMLYNMPRTYGLSLTKRF